MIQIPRREALTRQALAYGVRELGNRLPGFLLSQAEQRCFKSVEVPSTDPTFVYLNDWASDQGFILSSSRFQVSSSFPRQEIDDEDDQVLVRYHPAPGTYRFQHNGHIMWLTRTAAHWGAADVMSRYGWKTNESIHLRVLGTSTEPIKQLIDEACATYKEKKQRNLTLYYAKESWWDRSVSQPLRQLESVILPQGQREDLTADVEKFIARREWYQSMGIPYRRGYLLHGVPGSGKTSVVLALASHFNLPIYILNLSSGKMDDSVLGQLMGNMLQPSILLLEDVDAIFTQRERGESISFSGLLNALDGASASQGRLLFLTTNCVDQLDPALVRPGRVDYRLEFFPADVDQAVDILLRFFPTAPEDDATAFGWWVRNRGMSMAEVQEFLLNRSDDLELVANEVYQVWAV